ncbi:RhoGAP [Acrasis kona]|uniref:RhoGAP n=1 Tax=Acrasis kona TaxID=1008807 RepID=A0AAW2Z3V8_9EUKA
MSMRRKSLSASRVLGEVSKDELSELPAPANNVYCTKNFAYKAATDEIPQFAWRTLEFIEEKGIEVKRMFAEEPNPDDIKKAESEIERFGFIDNASYNIRVSSTLLKRFLKNNLPFGEEVGTKVIACSGITNMSARLKMLIKQLELLSPSYQKFVQCLFRTLQRITMFTDVNDMTTKSLYEIFAPILFNQYNPDSDNQQINIILQTMIDQATAIFGEKVDEEVKKQAMRADQIKRVLEDSEYDEFKQDPPSPTSPQTKLIRSSSGRFASASRRKSSNPSQQCRSL